MSALAAQAVVTTATAFADLVVYLLEANDTTGLTCIIDDGWTI